MRDANQDPNPVDTLSAGLGSDDFTWGIACDRSLTVKDFGSPFPRDVALASSQVARHSMTSEMMDPTFLLDWFMAMDGSRQLART
jgi:hypothetical protein